MSRFRELKLLVDQVLFVVVDVSKKLYVPRQGIEAPRFLAYSNSLLVRIEIPTTASIALDRFLREGD